MEKWAGYSSALMSLMFLYSVMSKFFPSQLRVCFRNHTRRLVALAYPYVQIKVPEYGGERLKRSEAYASIESYLSSSCSQQASKLKVDFGRESEKLVVSMDDHEEVTDEFEGVKMYWTSTLLHSSRGPASPDHPAASEERRSYKLTFHKSHRDLVIAKYLLHVMKEGRDVCIRNRQRKLFTNSVASSPSGHRKSWNHVTFDHPACFSTMAMESKKKKEIMDDLDMFRKGKDYYAKIGKAWKRGYLLYGPPGTGKSSMVAAIANYMDYDIYDLELTTVKTNTDLRKLLIQTTSKSIILIEDIDCSLELTGRRKHKKANMDSAEKNLPLPEEEKDEQSSRVTLSGLLNFIDGLWSASVGERLIVFTTNHIEKLDPALIRRGRMDRHIEMSYCGFEAFKVLVMNYMGIDSHPLFDRVQELMEEVKITPADVAENLMPKSIDEDVDTCLSNLIQALRAAKDQEALKGESDTSSPRS